MNIDDEITIIITTRGDLGLIRDALELLEDAEHLRPERQDLARALINKLEQQ
jgi:hypothetical protein